ncbi:hypothetical protein pb186bvf_013279 [Paramecium bursaria]
MQKQKNIQNYINKNDPLFINQPPQSQDAQINPFKYQEMHEVSNQFDHENDYSFQMTLQVNEFQQNLNFQSG